MPENIYQLMKELGIYEISIRSLVVTYYFGTTEIGLSKSDFVDKPEIYKKLVKLEKMFRGK